MDNLCSIGLVLRDTTNACALRTLNEEGRGCVDRRETERESMMSEMEGASLISLLSFSLLASKILPKVKTYLLENADADATKVVDFYPPKELLELIKVQLPKQASSKETVSPLHLHRWLPPCSFASIVSLETLPFPRFLHAERADRTSVDEEDTLTGPLSLSFLTCSFLRCLSDCVRMLLHSAYPCYSLISLSLSLSIVWL